jgi:O-antigen ligase
MDFFSKITSHQGRLSIAACFLLVVFSYLLGLLILRSYVLSIVFVFGFPTFLFLRAKPELGILAIVILVSSIIFEDALPLIPIRFGNFHIPDALLLLLLFVIPFNRIINKEFQLVKTPLDLPLLLFYLAALSAACLAILKYKLDFTETMKGLRPLTYYLLFFVVTNLIRSERQVRLLVKGLFCIGVGVGGAMLAQAIIGESVQLMPGRIEAVITSEKMYGAIRVLPPGQSLVYVLFITGVCFIAYPETTLLKAWHFLLVLSTGVGVALTYNRSYWVACICCFTVFILFAGSQPRKRMMVLFLICSFAVMAIYSGYWLSNTRGRGGGTVSAVSDRFSSLFSGSRLDDSMEWRKIENEYALPQIAKHPLIGIGLGNHYRPQFFYSGDTLTSYIHNGYLWLLLNVGLMGAAPFLWCYLAFIIRGFRNLKNVTDHYLRSLLTGFTLSVAGALLINVVNPMVMQKFSIVALSIILGLGEAIIRMSGIELHKQHE